MNGEIIQFDLCPSSTIELSPIATNARNFRSFYRLQFWPVLCHARSIDLFFVLALTFATETAATSHTHTHTHEHSIPFRTQFIVLHAQNTILIFACDFCSEYRADSSRMYLVHSERLAAMELQIGNDIKVKLMLLLCSALSLLHASVIATTATQRIIIISIGSVNAIYMNATKFPFSVFCVNVLRPSDGSAGGN